MPGGAFDATGYVTSVGGEGGPGPTGLSHCTTNTYPTPFTRPWDTHPPREGGVATHATHATQGPGVEVHGDRVAVQDSRGAPPVAEGGSHVSATWALPGEASTFWGAPGGTSWLAWA